MGCAEAPEKGHSNTANVFTIERMTAFFFFLNRFILGHRKDKVLSSFESPAEGRQCLPKGKNQAADLPEARTQNNPWLVSPHLSQHSCGSVIILYLRRLAASFYVTMIYLNNVNKIDFLIKNKA